MGAQKSLIKNIALFLLIGAIPSIGWASGYIAAFSWATFFLLTGGVFCLLWLKERHTHQTLRNILLTHEDAWAIGEGDQIVQKSPSFPTDSLQSFKDLLHSDTLQQVEHSISELIHKNTPFKIKVHSDEKKSIYELSGKPFGEKFVFWLRNITDSSALEHFYAENLTKKDNLIHQLHATLDMLPLPVWQRDQDQRITYCNQAYAQSVGEVPQLVQKEGIELIPPRNAHVNARKALHTHEPQSLECTVVVQEERRHLRICEIPNIDEQGTLGIAFDITELKDAQKETKDLMEAQGNVLSHLPTAIAIYDAAGTLQYYNQAYVNLYSFDEDFLKTHPGLDEVLEDLRSRRQLPEYADFPTYKKMCLQNLKEQLEPIEELMHLPDERTIRNFSAPHPMGGLLFIYEDVTNYLSLERNNKTLIESYQATLDHLFEGIIVIGSDNRLKIFNPSFLRIWEFEKEDLTAGQHLTLIVDKLKDFLEYDGEWEDYKAQFIENVTDRFPKSGQLIRKDGIILNFSYLPLPNGNHLLSYVDTTDTYRVQQALQEKNQALETADLLKSEFIESVSFELKAPLNTIIGFTEVLHNQHLGELNEKQKDYVEGVLDSSTKLLYLVNDILDLASIEAGYLNLNHTTVDIPSLLQTITKIVSKKAEQNKQHIILKCDPNVTSWVVDERRLKQALLNLLSNAIKFTPSHGKITIEALVVEDELLLSVMDTSVGLSSEEEEKLLRKVEAGKTTKLADSGIGLSLVKNLIELHGGRIELFSEINKGTIIRCFLPRIPLETQLQEETKLASQV